MSDAVISSLKIEIETDSKNTGNALDSLIKRLERLENICNGTSNAQEKVSSSSSKMYDRLSKIQSVLSRASSYMRSFTNKCAEWFNASNDYVEAVNLFSVTMGNGADEAKRYADTLQDLMGIDVQEWMNYQGSYNQMLNGFGLDSNISNEMSQQLTQIAYDLSSLWNVDVETAFKKVQSGMSGQIKGLKVWGINLSVAQLKETALAHGIELSTAKMTEAQKATLRYVTLMEKTTNVQGDLARTIVTPANAMRILTAQTTRAKRALGNIVSVLVVKFIPVMQTVVLWLERMANSIASKLGYELPEIDYSGIDLSSSYVDDLDDSLTEATESAKKLKKTLLGFDELNVLNSESTASTTTALGGGLPSDLGLDLSQYSYDFTQGLTAFDTSAIEETLRKITIIVTSALLAIGAVLTFTGANIPLGIALMIVGLVGLVAAVAVDWKSTENKVGTVLSVLAGIIGGASLALGALLALTGVATGLGIALMALGATTLVTAVAINWNSTSDKVNEIIDIISISISSAMLVLGMILLLSGGNVALGVALIAAGAVTLATEIAVDWNTMSDQMKSVITTITSIVSGALLAIGMTLAVLGHYVLGIALLAAGAVGLVATIVLNWDTLKNDLGATIQVIAGVVGGALLVIGAILAFSGVGIPLGISLMLAGAASLAVAISLNWDSVKSKINTVLSSILSIISGAAIAIGVLLCLSGAGIGLGIAMIMLGLKGVQKAEEIDSNPVTKWVKSICNGAIDLVEKAINKIIHLINSFGFTWDVPDWLQSVVGFKSLKVGFSLSEVSIPRLETGAMNIPKGQLFQARESGPELVGTIGNKSAVVNNDQIVASVEGGVYRGVRDAIADSGERSDGGDHSLVVMIGGEVVHKGFVKWHNDEVKITGRSPLNV